MAIAPMLGRDQPMTSEQSKNTVHHRSTEEPQNHVQCSTKDPPRSTKERRKIAKVFFIIKGRVLRAVPGMGSNRYNRFSLGVRAAAKVQVFVTGST